MDVSVRPAGLWQAGRPAHVARSLHGVGSAITAA